MTLRQMLISTGGRRRAGRCNAGACERAAGRNGCDRHRRHRRRGHGRRTEPEAGVWVIAETTDLPTRYTKSVVTDDQGRYVIPDLPAANYQVWVRGYGLVDSPKMRAKPGQTAQPHRRAGARRPAAAAHYYPAIYWYTMMKIPPEKDFGGATDIPKNITRDDLASSA